MNLNELSWGDEQAKLLREGRFNELDTDAICAVLNRLRGQTVERVWDMAESMFFQMLKLAEMRANLEERIEIERGRLVHQLDQAGYTDKDTAQALQIAWERALIQFCHVNRLDWGCFPFKMPASTEQLLSPEFYPTIEMAGWLDQEQRGLFIGRTVGHY